MANLRVIRGGEAAGSEAAGSEAEAARPKGEVNESAAAVLRDLLARVESGEVGSVGVFGVLDGGIFHGFSMRTASCPRELALLGSAARMAELRVMQSLADCGGERGLNGEG